MILPKLALAILIGIAAFACSPSSADEAEQAALCRGDVMRLCMGEIPDRDRIGSCMKAKLASLSPGCKTVFVGGLQEAGAQSTARVR